MDEQNAFAVLMNRLKLQARHATFRGDCHTLGGSERAGSSDSSTASCNSVKASSLTMPCTFCGGHAEILCQAYGALHDVGVYQFFSSPQARSASAKRENLTAYISSLLAMEVWGVASLGVASVGHFVLP